jgi:hypothetical protein
MAFDGETTMDSFVGQILAQAGHLSGQGQTAWAMLVLMVWPLTFGAGLLWAQGMVRGQEPSQRLAAKCLCLGMGACSLPLLALLGASVLA